MPKTRRLAAIMFTDIVGYTAMMQGDEARALELRTRHREVFERYHTKYAGKILQYYGDGTLSVFDSAIDAAKCAVDMQKALQQEPIVPLRIGIHTGDIIYSKEEAFGDGVNIAARIESMAAPGSVMISERVFNYIKNQSDLPAQSMGIFSFKNVEKPIEVYAIHQEGIFLPNPKNLEGKFTRRVAKNPRYDIRRIPIWLRYVGGLALFLLLAPVLYYPFLQGNLVAAEETVKAVDEYGNTMSSTVVGKEEIKTFFVAPFKNKSGVEDVDWLSLGIPFALEMDWDQDPHIFNIFPESKKQATLNEFLERANGRKTSFLLMGEYEVNDSNAYVLDLRFYQSQSGQLVHDHQYVGKDLFSLLDEVSRETKLLLGVPEEHVNTVKDLPVNQFLTQSIEAYRYFCEGIVEMGHNNKKGYENLDLAVKTDPTFAWAHYRISDSHHRFQRSKNLADEHISKAMQYRNRLPEVFNAEIRQLQYRIKDEPEKALQLIEMMARLNPNNSVFQFNLIQEYVLQNEYEKALIAINTYREQWEEPFSQLKTEIQCLLFLDREKEAINQLQNYLRQNPGDVEATSLLGQAYDNQGKWAKAKENYEKVALLKPEYKTVQRWMDHLAFMEDSAHMITPEFYKEIEGRYLTVFGNFEFRAIAAKRKLFIQVKNQWRTILYPMDTYHYVSQWGMRQSFLPNSLGKIDRMETIEEEGFPYMAYKIDSTMQRGLDAFSRKQFDIAEPFLRESYTIHPQHHFLKLYLDHITFQKSPGYLEAEDRKSLFVSDYSTQNYVYTISLRNDQLVLSSETNTRFVDPIPLFSLGNDLFMLDGNMGRQIQFVFKGNRLTGFDFIEIGGDKIFAKAQ